MSEFADQKAARSPATPEELDRARLAVADAWDWCNRAKVERDAASNETRAWRADCFAGRVVYTAHDQIMRDAVEMSVAQKQQIAERAFVDANLRYADLVTRDVVLE